MARFEHVFGPVPSRRLGRSLGVDLVPFKTCTYDCIYCQLGRTTHKTIERREWVPLDEVVGELRAKLASRPDYVTLSGSGEPTLHSRLDELIGQVHRRTDIPVAVLTNGSLLWQRQVQDQLLEADLVMPSLDAGDAALFRAINRPHDAISFEAMVEGLADFRRRYKGRYWLEVMILGGHTAVEAEVAKLAAHVRRIRPDRVQLNTVTRPPAEDFAAPVPAARLRELAALFDPPAEVIAPAALEPAAASADAGPEAILEVLRRRPCTLEDLACGLDLHPSAVLKCLEALRADGRVAASFRDRVCYWQAGAERRDSETPGPRRPG